MLTIESYLGTAREEKQICTGLGNVDHAKRNNILLNSAVVYFVTGSEL